MSLVTRLVHLLSEAAGTALDPDRALEVSDETLAAAALLVHVARADGRISEGERQTLLAVLGRRYGLTPSEAEALVWRAERFDQEVDDVSALVEMLRHEDHGPERRRLLAMASRVATADGSAGEFEEALLWRMGHLLGFADREIRQIRADEADGRLTG